MVVETQPQPFWQWLVLGSDASYGALPWFLIVVASLSFVALVIGYLIAAVRYGPMKAGDLTYRVVVGGLKELFVLAPRRVIALAWLAVKESLRRHVLVAIIVFLLILLFASWFLGTDHAEPAQLYLNFVLTATTYLVLLLALFLSAFSLPNDIKNKTIHTIVTKPVRAGEIVLGRIIGFTFMGTLMLAIMGVCSYFFVLRALHHTHELEINSLTDVEASIETVGKEGRTSRSNFHRHEVAIDAEGNGEALTSLGHWHGVSAGSEGGRIHYDVGSPQDMFGARVPVYGKLRFLDRTGAAVEKGISVGNEWTYRSYIEGGSNAAAIWTFEGIDEASYPERLPLELTVSVFRTHKGSIVKGILGSIQVKNPEDSEKASNIINFTAKEYSIDQKFIKRDLIDSEGDPLDLFDDLVHEGKVEIWIQCLDSGQYFGMAQPDCYVRAHEGTFAGNFLKGFVSIWVQMVLVTCIAVTCSTILSGPVAMMFTLSVIVLGFFKKFIVGIAMGSVVGGGPIESLVRLVTQKNVTTELDAGVGTTLIKIVDTVFIFIMYSFSAVLPDFRSFSTVRHVSDGFDISINLLMQNVVIGLAYLFGLFVIGYFLLRTREVAK